MIYVGCIGLFCIVCCCFFNWRVPVYQYSNESLLRYDDERILLAKDTGDLLKGEEHEETPSVY